MNLFNAVMDTFTPKATPEVPPIDDDIEVVAESSDDVVISIKAKDRGDSLRAILKGMRDRRDAALKPHEEKRAELLSQMAKEREVIDAAENYSVERAMAEQGDQFDRDELQRLRTAADVSAQVLAIKKREAGEVAAAIDRIQLQWQREDSYLMKICEDVTLARRNAVVMVQQEGRQFWKLNAERLVRELKMIQHCKAELLKQCGDEALAEAAITEITRIDLPSDARVLYWEATSAKQKNENPQLNPFSNAAPEGDNNE